MPPSQRPDRRERLLIVGVDRDSHRVGSWEITRPDGKPQLGEFQTADNAGFVALSGAFRGLIKDDGTRQ